MKDHDSSDLSTGFRSYTETDDFLVHDQSGDAYAEGYNGHLRPCVLMKIACGEHPHSDVLAHLRDCEDARCVKRLSGFCKRFGKELPPWLSTRREQEAPRRIVLAPMRLAASKNDPVVLGEWTVCIAIDEFYRVANRTRCLCDRRRNGNDPG